METIALKYKPLRIDDNFYDFCAQNDQLKMERDSEGIIFIVPGSGGITGMLNATINYWLMHWHLAGNIGHVFDSSTAFRLPNTSVRSPDVAWVSAERWERLTRAEKRNSLRYAPIL